MKLAKRAQKGDFIVVELECEKEAWAIGQVIRAAYLYSGEAREGKNAPYCGAIKNGDWLIDIRIWRYRIFPLFSLLKGNHFLFHFELSPRSIRI